MSVRLDALSRAINRGHAVGMGVVVVVALWLMRAFIFSSRLPAGTDMLGFITRARENAVGGRMFSLWAPSVFGAPRQFTFDNILGALTILTRDPVVTVKLVAVLALFSSGALTYLLAFRWSRSRRAAAFAGILYMTSQASLSRWASGQINVEIATAAAPLLIYLWVRCIDRHDTSATIAFAIAVTAVMLVRLDMILYLVPFFVLYPLIRVAIARDRRRALRGMSRSLLVLIPAVISLNSLQWFPWIMGIRAPWVSGSGLFTLDSITDRSLAAYPSLLGMGREIGYLGFTGQQTWFSHPYVPTWTYFAAATLLVALAYGALLKWRDIHSLFLASSAILATFLAKGLRAPLGGPYEWAVQHIPVFSNMRNPNRWLIIQSLAYAVLGAVSLDAAYRWLRRRAPHASTFRIGMWMGVRAVSFTMVLLLPVAPTLLSGFRSWMPSAEQTALMDRVGRDQHAFLVATVPYDQSVRFLEQGSYRGYEHDLGAESSSVTGHPSLTDGGWNSRSANFVAFTSSLLRSADPAYQKLLGTVGVRNLIRFDYPVSAPHLAEGQRGVRFQQHSVDRIPGFLPLATNGAGSVYQLQSWSPPVSFRPNIAVVLGGPAGLASLADMSGIHLNRWAALTAEDVLAGGGMTGLENLIARSNLVLVSNGSIQDVGVMASPPVASLPGITSDLGLDRLTQLVAADESVRNGSLADNSAAAAAPGSPTASTTFSTTSARPTELWTRVQYQPNASRLLYVVDGVRVGTLVPVAPIEAGFRWVRVASPFLNPGQHQLSVRAIPSSISQGYELDETRLVDATVRKRMDSRLVAAVTAASSKAAYSFDLGDAEKWTDASLVRRSAFRARDISWEPIEPEFVALTPTTGADGSNVVSVDVAPGRSRYTVLDHQFRTAQDWSNDPFLFLRLKGSGSEEVFELVIRFRTGEAHFVIPDTWQGWRTVSLAASQPDRGTPPFDWSAVSSVRLAVDTRQTPLRFQVGRLSLGSMGDSLLNLPVVPSDSKRLGTVQGSRVSHSSRETVPIQVGAHAARANAPYRQLTEPSRRLIVPPETPIREVGPPNLQFSQGGDTEFRFSLDSPSDGILMLNQAYDPHWELSGGPSDPLPVFSVANGYLLGEGLHSGTIHYSGTSVGHLGLWLSASSLFGLLCAAGVARRRRQRARSPRGGARSSRRHRVPGPLSGAAVGILAVAVLVVSIPREPVSAAAPVDLPTAKGVWQTIDPGRVRVHTSPGLPGMPVTGVVFDGPRRFYTLVQHRFASPPDWIGRRYLFLSFKGQGDRSGYRLIVDFDTPGAGSAAYEFRDVNPGWRVLVVRLWKPDQITGTLDWNRVSGIRLARDSIAGHGSVALGALAVSKPVIK